MNPFHVVEDFEEALSQYTGAPYVVTTTSCTMALLLAVAWHMKFKPRSMLKGIHGGYDARLEVDIEVEIPKRTYVGVPMSIIHAGGRPTFRDEDWIGAYQLKPLPVWDSARRFTSGMYMGITSGGHVRDGSGQMACVSFHWSKILGISQGGAILHDNAEADVWLRKARFDGRTVGVAPKEDTFDMIGWHAYMSPEVAAEGLVRLSLLPKNNPDLKNSDYPDLSELAIFK